MPDATAGGFRESMRLLATRRFGTFWFASFLSSVGTWAQLVAEPWLLLTLGASPFLIGLDSFAMNAPVWLLTLAGGALADRSDRRQVIVRYQSLQMLCPIVIVVLLVTGGIRPWIVIALAVVIGVTDALSMPSFQSIVPSIVEHDDIGRALALNSTQFNLSRILGPSLAGVLMSSVGVIACFAISAVSYVPFIGVAVWILPRHIAATPRVAAPRWEQTFTDLRDMVRQPRLRDALLIVLTTSVLCAPLITFIPVLVKDVFGGSAAHFSTAVAAFGVGGLLGAAGLLGVAPTANQHRLSVWFALVYAAVLVLIGFNRWFWAVPVLLAIGGAAMTVSNTAANTLLQTTAPPRLLGRTVSLYMLAMRGGLAIGALVTGVLVSQFGVQRALLLNGSVAIAAGAVIARQSR